MSNYLKGIMLSIASVISFALMAILVRSIPQVSSFQTVFFRFAIGLGIISILGLTRVIPLKFNNSKFLLLRGLIGGVAVYFFYITIINLGIGKGSVYIYSYPAFATLLSILILKEKVKPVKFIPIATSIIGLVVLSLGKGAESIESFGWGEIFGVLGSLTTGLAVVIVKKLHDSDNSYTIFFAQCIIGFWMFLIPSRINQSQGNSSDLTIIILIGVVAAIGQLLMTEGYRYINVATGSLIQSLVPVFNLLAACFIFGETFNLKEIAGVIIVLLSCFSLIVINYTIGIKTRILKKID